MDNKYIIYFRSSEYDKVMVFSKDTIVKDVLTQYLKETNSIIDLSLNKYTFVYRASILNSDKYLNKSLLELFKYRKNQRHVIRILISNSISAGVDEIEFCDVSNGKQELINPNIIYGTPSKGINIYGFCKEKNCIAYNQEVVVPINKNYFDLLGQKHDLKCPKCNNIIIPNTVGFLQCEYKVKGTKYEGHEEFNINGIANKSDKIEYYNWKENINGKAKMVELNFEVNCL